MNKLEKYSGIIAEISPEIRLESLELNEDGLLNDVVIVNGEYVFRFAKRDFYFKNLLDEANLLNYLKDFLTLEIPRPFYATGEIMAYRIIRGEALRRDILWRLSDAEQQTIADQLALFFKELHSVPLTGEIPTADVLVKYEGWLAAYEKIREKVFPLLMPHIRDSVREHYENFLADAENFRFEPKMVDTDIPPYHILFDREMKRISGIINFGCAGAGDPAADFSVILYNYGEPFFRRFFKIYPEAEFFLRRARFYAGAIEARWILTGIERKNDWWFAVHLGGAKDFGYN
ncbi:MAG TPA: phosphotransferase [Pyrinomonadaceae bacterium]|jgi:aminoglycoside 2''-phosphotransferase